MPFVGLDDELSALRDEVVRLRAENERLLRLLELTPQQARPPGPVQTGVFDGEPGPVHAGSPAAAKVAFFAGLFAARTEVYAVRWENPRTGRAGWVPSVRGGWRKGVPAAEREYLPLTEEVITAPASWSWACIRCSTVTAAIGWPPTSTAPPPFWMRSLPEGGPRGRRIRGARSVPLRPGRARVAILHRTRPRGHRPPGRQRPAARGDRRTRADGPGQLRPALPHPGRRRSRGLGNLIAAPLQGRARRRGATVFLDLATLEPHEDQWAYLSTIGRLTPKEVSRLAQRLGRVTVGPVKPSV